MKLSARFVLELVSISQLVLLPCTVSSFLNTAAFSKKGPAADFKQQPLSWLARPIQ